MELTFEDYQQISAGNSPAAVHFGDQTAQIFYTGDGGRLYAIDTTTPEGAWNNREFSSPLIVASDSDIEDITLRRISRYGVYGSWLSDNRHRFVIYGFDYDVSNYIEDGNMQFGIGNPIAQVSLSLANPAQDFANEDYSAVGPGSKIMLAFRSGDSESYPMGTFYDDRSGFDVTGENCSIDGRNTIGKVLKDQSFDDKNNYPKQNLKTLIESILSNAGISSAKYYVADTDLELGMQFPPDMNFLDGFTEIFKAVSGWHMEELLDGSIAIGPDSYEKFTQPSKYTFYRNKDIFSRKITRDDADCYKRLCVKTADYTTYRTISGHQGWGMGAQKTLYVSMADGTAQADVDAYADTLAAKLANVGTIETFVGPFKPHLQILDEAEIINETGNASSLGTITSITHRFGKSGYYTEFTVDSGGRIGRYKISDYISKISQGKSSNATRLY